MGNTFVAVEGPHDVELVSALLESMAFHKETKLERLRNTFCERLIDTKFPHRGDLHQRVPNPMFLTNGESWVAVQACGGDTEIAATVRQAFNQLQLQPDLFSALGIVRDADAELPQVQVDRLIARLDDMSAILRAYVEESFAAGKRDLYTAFMLRCSELTFAGGRVGMVVPQTWMFLGSFSDFRLLASTDSTQPARSGMLCETTIETLTQLGRHAFNEVDPPSNVVLVVWRIDPPHTLHRCNCFRITASRPADEQASLLLRAIHGRLPEACFRPQQVQFWAIPHAPLVYWLSETLLRLVAQQPQIGRGEQGWLCVRDGMNTGNNERFVRFQREHDKGGEWVPLSKGGGYRKWCGNDMFSVRWRETGQAIKAAQLVGTRLQNTGTFFQSVLCYTLMARGALGVRLLDNSAFDGTGLAIDPVDPGMRLEIAALLNTRVPSFLCRLFSQSAKFRGGYVERIPIPYDAPTPLRALGQFAMALKAHLTSKNPLERSFRSDPAPPREAWLCESGDAALLHATEGAIEERAGLLYHLTPADLEPVYRETGIPVGLFPPVKSFSTLPHVLVRADIPSELLQFVESHSPAGACSESLAERVEMLRRAYEIGPGADVDGLDTVDAEQSDADDETEAIAGARLPIRAETFLEELSQKLEIHPISVYWLLKEGIAQHGWRCLPEEQRLARDQFTVLILCLLGHRWPKQIEAGESVPDWADVDGIVPLTESAGESTVFDRLVERNSFRLSAPSQAAETAAETGNGMNSVLREFAELMGKPLEQWLATEFFKHHTSQFKKRPIAWQIQSNKFTARTKPAFACFVYYHKLDGDLLEKIRTQYVGPLRQRWETELRGIESVVSTARSDRQTARRTELGDLIKELQDFDASLRAVQESGFEIAGLRQFAIQDSLLCMKARWLRRLSETIQAGSLSGWKTAADGVASDTGNGMNSVLRGFENLADWIDEAFIHLDHHCSRVGPEQWKSSDDPTPPSLAALICQKPASLVASAVDRANQRWWGQLDELVLAPLRREMSQKRETLKGVQAELKRLAEEALSPAPASGRGETIALTPGAAPKGRGELQEEERRLKAEIKELKKKLDGIMDRANQLRKTIGAWQCPEAAGWEPWLAGQPMYDAISSVDGRRRPPTTVVEWIAQEQSYVPDINDGVRVNIAPLQKAGLLAAEVLAKKDLDKAIADRAEWRADERGWCREGKLPQPGWWPS